MIDVVFFVKTQSDEEARFVATEVINSLNDYLTSFVIYESEQYWKIEEYYRTGCTLYTKEIIDYVKAEEILYKIADKWDWKPGQDSATACERMTNSKFINDKLTFVSIWFEDLEGLDDLDE